MAKKDVIAQRDPSQSIFGGVLDKKMFVSYKLFKEKVESHCWTVLDVCRSPKDYDDLREVTQRLEEDLVARAAYHQTAMLQSWQMLG